MRVNIIGTGRVAQALGHALIEADVDIISVAGRDELKRNALAKKLNAAAVSIGTDIPSADLNIIAVSDDAIAEVSKALEVTDSIVIHTSGTTGMGALDKHEHQGVLWPIQTIIEPDTALSDVPLVIEGNSVDVSNKLKEVASLLSSKVLELPLEKRKKLHLAAVLVSNFPVLMVKEAFGIASGMDLDPDLLLPLWKGMTERVSAQGKDVGITGPAVRGDRKTMTEHLELLSDDDELKELYQLLSVRILEKYHGKTDV